MLVSIILKRGIIMYTKISNCYYHVERPSVALCSKCGVGICRECAVKDGGRILCVSCGNENLKMEHKQYRQMLKQQGGRFKSAKEFIIPGIIGLLIILTIVVLIGFTDSEAILREINHCNNIYQIFGLLLAGIFIAYALFSVPFAVILMNDIFAPKYDTRWNILSKWYFRFWIALFFGWIVFTFYLVRFIIIRIKAKKEHNSS